MSTRGRERVRQWSVRDLRLVAARTHEQKHRILFAGLDKVFARASTICVASSRTQARLNRRSDRRLAAAVRSCAQRGMVNLCCDLRISCGNENNHHGDAGGANISGLGVDSMRAHTVTKINLGAEMHGVMRVIHELRGSSASEERRNGRKRFDQVVKLETEIGNRTKATSAARVHCATRCA